MVAKRRETTFEASLDNIRKNDPHLAPYFSDGNWFISTKAFIFIMSGEEANLLNYLINAATIFHAQTGPYDGWFYLTRKKLLTEYPISYTRQKRLFAKLTKRGFILMDKRRPLGRYAAASPVRWIKINSKAIDEAIIAEQKRANKMITELGPAAYHRQEDKTNHCHERVDEHTDETINGRAIGPVDGTDSAPIEWGQYRPLLDGVDTDPFTYVDGTDSAPFDGRTIDP